MWENVLRPGNQVRQFIKIFSSSVKETVAVIIETQKAKRVINIGLHYKRKRYGKNKNYNQGNRYINVYVFKWLYA